MYEKVKQKWCSGTPSTFLIYFFWCLTSDFSAKVLTAPCSRGEAMYRRVATEGEYQGVRFILRTKPAILVLAIEDCT